jgi:hypothetical protein
MSLPDRERAKHWVDRGVVDASGVELGTCVRVYADLETGAPEWLLLTRDEGQRAVVPLLNATESDDRITVQVPADLVATAPLPAGEDRLSTEEEAALYSHYGVEYSADASDSILPSEVTEADTADAVGATPETAPTPVAEPAAHEPVTEPDVAVSPPPAPKTWQPDIPPQPQPKGGASKIVALSGGLAALFGLLFARRRLVSRRQSPSTKRALRRSTRRAAARTAAAANVAAARTAAARELAATKAAAATNVAKTKAAATAKTAAAQAANSARHTAANTAAAVGSGGITVGRTAGRVGAQVAGQSIKLGARGAAGAGRSSRELARSRRERRRNKKAALRAVKATAQESAAKKVADKANKKVTVKATNVKKRGRSTMGKIKTGLTLGIGYVLGTRAGRQRYEQIRRVSNTVAQRPEVQRTTAKVGGAVASKLPPTVAGKLPPSVASKLVGTPPPPSTPPLPPSAF